jgi:malignant T-cell-amplified sequence
MIPTINATESFLQTRKAAIHTHVGKGNMPTSSDLFKKFTLESVAQIATSKLKEQKEVRSKLADEYPMLADLWDELLPKGEDILIIRCHDQVHCIARQSSKPEVLFFNHHGGFYYPHLRLLHKYPFILKSHQVDIGGCRFVVSGANIMCQGLTSAGGRIQDNMDEDDLVAIYIEGKEHAVAVGKMMMSSDDIREKNKGPCIENVHHMGDGLWINYQLSASHIGGGASAIRPEDASK